MSSEQPPDEFGFPEPDDDGSQNNEPKNDLTQGSNGEKIKVGRMGMTS